MRKKMEKEKEKRKQQEKREKCVRTPTRKRGIKKERSEYSSELGRLYERCRSLLSARGEPRAGPRLVVAVAVVAPRAALLPLGHGPPRAIVAGKVLRGHLGRPTGVGPGAGSVLAAVLLEGDDGRVDGHAQQQEHERHRADPQEDVRRGQLFRHVCCGIYCDVDRLLGNIGAGTTWS